jgi:hypothetical protein
MYPITEETLTFTTTAMPRPELIEKTYASFQRMLLDIDIKKCTLFINIDSFPNQEDKAKKDDVISIARRYFGNVIPNTPVTGNFPLAVKWCFSKIETYYNFHLEDDWELLTPFKVSLFNQFFVAPHVQQVAFRAWKHAGSDFWLSPSFIRGSFCRAIAEKMNDAENPEVQIRRIKNEYKNESFLSFPFDHRAVVLKDLGREWMKSQNFNRGDFNFVTWEMREKGKGIQRLADQNAQIPSNMFPFGVNKQVSMNNKMYARNQTQKMIKLRKRGK